jgi:hypothetical protein
VKLKKLFISALCAGLVLNCGFYALAEPLTKQEIQQRIGDVKARLKDECQKSVTITNITVTDTDGTQYRVPNMLSKQLPLDARLFDRFLSEMAEIHLKALRDGVEDLDRDQAIIFFANEFGAFMVSKNEVWINTRKIANGLGIGPSNVAYTLKKMGYKFSMNHSTTEGDVLRSVGILHPSGILETGWCKITAPPLEQ